NEKVIVLGDMNDVLTDRLQDNVFTAFLNNEDYLMADMEIAEGSSTGWSYPNWPSHLDHIIISNELSEIYNNSSSSCEIIKLEEHFYGGFNEYDNKVSDHRPIGIKLKTNDQTAVGELDQMITLQNYPNPFTQNTTVFFNPASQNTELEIYNIKGQLVSKDDVLVGQVSYVWNAQNQPQGIYYGQLSVDKKPTAIWKMILLK
ncbi:MAG: T9SS type A sorting domain-containing protein, partial [Bacteroidales bacterium]|nr:T9SS type A sorting domain-containing protein [Bacteroidales bacterium]